MSEIPCEHSYVVMKSIGQNVADFVDECSQFQSIILFITVSFMG